VLLNVRRPPSFTGLAPVRSMSYNAAERALLINYDGEGAYELFQVPRDVAKGGAQDITEGKRGIGVSALFIARNRFATLEKGGCVVVRNLKNEVTKRVLHPVLQSADMLLPANAGNVLLRSEGRVTLFDLQQRRVLGEFNTGSSVIRHAIWAGTEKNANVALMSKDTVFILNARLEQLCMVNETMRVKGGGFDENGVLIYTTSTHLKYLLPNGDGGLVRTLETPLYVTLVRGSRIHALDREARPRVIAIDSTEYVFKLALVRHKYDDVRRMVKESNLIGQSIIAYLEKKGYPEVALQFVKDERTRLSLV
jgi:coatomer protein complex subunit alpha (xenin)